MKQCNATYLCQGAGDELFLSCALIMYLVFSKSAGKVMLFVIYQNQKHTFSTLKGKLKEGCMSGIFVTPVIVEACGRFSANGG